MSFSDFVDLAFLIYLIKLRTFYKLFYLWLSFPIIPHNCQKSNTSEACELETKVDEPNLKKSSKAQREEEYNKLDGYDMIFASIQPYVEGEGLVGAFMLDNAIQ